MTQKKEHIPIIGKNILGILTSGMYQNPLMIYDEHRPEDLDTDLEDHVCDEWRYMCMARPIKPVVREEPEEVGADPLEQFTGRRVRYLPGYGGM